MQNDTNKIFRSSTRPKGDKTRQAIIASAKKELMDVGIEELSYQAIAGHAGITRQLVRHHFPEKQQLLIEVAIEVREEYQRLCLAQMERGNNAKEIFDAYVKTALSWAIDFPKQLSIWLQFLRICSQNQKIRKFHDELASIGHRRIEEILFQGQSEGHFAAGDTTKRAKMIQVTITGALLTMATEEEASHQISLQSAAYLQCLTIARTPGMGSW